MVRITSVVVHGLLYLSTAAPLSLLVMTEARADDPVVRFNVPAEPLPQALIDFYHQSGVQPGFAATERMTRAKSSPISGTMASSQALQLMLQGTGYTYRFDTDNSVDIIPAAPDAAPKPEATVAHVSPPPAPPLDRYGGRLEQVNVTGSLIRGVQDAVAPLIYLKPQQLAMADYETVQDSLYTQPIMSLNGPREDLGIDANYQYGAGLDLTGPGCRRHAGAGERTTATAIGSERRFRRRIHDPVECGGAHRSPAGWGFGALRLGCRRRCHQHHHAE